MMNIELNGKQYDLSLKMRGLKYLEQQGISFSKLQNIQESATMATDMSHLAYAVLMGNEGVTMDFVDNLELEQVQDIISGAFSSSNLGGDLVTEGKPMAKA